MFIHAKSSISIIFSIILYRLEQAPGQEKLFLFHLFGGRHHAQGGYCVFLPERILYTRAAVLEKGVAICYPIAISFSGGC
jgi:hypothetical protein